MGTWDLVTLRAEWPDGNVSEPWGAHPFGRLVYDAEGRITAVLMHQDRNEASGRPSSPDLHAQMASYYGTYEVDAARTVVIHRVAASFRTNESGALERRYTFDDGRLVLAAPGVQAGVPVTYLLVWRRAPAVPPQP